MFTAAVTHTQIDFIVSMIRRADLFAGLNESELRGLADVFMPCTLSQGQYLFRQGDLGNFMALLISGTLGVRISNDPSANYDATLEPFEITGEMTCLDPAPRSASIIATSNAEVLILDRASVNELRTEAPRTYSALLRCIWQRVSTRLRVTNEAIGLYRDPNESATFFERIPSEIRPRTFEGKVRLREHEDFNGFASREIDMICGVAKKTFYPDGAFICREGEVAKACYIIASGGAKVFRDLGRQRYELGRLGPGDLFGQIALLERRRRSASVLAKGDTVVVEVDGVDFDRLVNSATPFGLRFQELVTVNGIRQLRSANHRYTIWENKM